MAFTDIDKPSDYMRIQTWSGNNSADREITWSESDNMQPNWIWVKRRSDSANHRIADSVRGATKILRSDTNGAETTESDDTLSFDTNGFSVGNNSGVNKTGDTYVGWGWAAGTSFSNDQSSTGVGSIDSAGSVNTDAGFSIIGFTGDAQTGTTIAHGLGVKPDMIILKNREPDTANWQVYHKSLGATHYVQLNTNGQATDSNTRWNDVEPTSSVFTTGSSGDVCGDSSGETFIAYCFAEKKGYSKFGSYKGNNNADGTFIFTGFKPAFVMVKLTDTQTDGWVIQDNKRDISNTGTSTRLRANTSDAEFTSTNEIDFLSNGFKPRGDDGEINGNGSKHIYMAFAENPFVTSTGVPTTAK